MLVISFFNCLIFYYSKMDSLLLVRFLSLRFYDELEISSLVLLQTESFVFKLSIIIIIAILNLHLV